MRTTVPAPLLVRLPAPTMLLATVTAPAVELNTKAPLLVTTPVPSRPPSLSCNVPALPTVVLPL